MAKRELPSPEALRQLLRYEPETGKLFWKERGAEWFEDGGGRYTAKRMASIWNTKYAGQEVSGLDASNGYIRVGILGRRAYAHRIIWAMQTGQWPDFDIDHVNGNRSSNLWGNLRSVSRKVNCLNQKRRVTNTSGMMGVSFNEKTGRWRAVISVDGLTRHIGVFWSFEDACAARRCAEASYGFHENHGR